MNKIKICGITNLEDALSCANLEVDFIGFIFYEKSPRYILPEQAKIICDKLAGNRIKKVGVFVNESIDKVNKIGDELNLDFIQLHGNENNDYIKKIKLETIKAFSVSNSLDDSYTLLNSTYWLFDTFDKDLYGGTGKSFNWGLISKIVDREKIILSGGLSIDNINKAMKESNTSFFDICSGVEKTPGTKDIKKLETIVRLIKQ